MSQVRELIYLSEAQYKELVANKTLTVGDITVEFNENNLYVTKDTLTDDYAVLREDVENLKNAPPPVSIDNISIVRNLEGEIQTSSIRYGSIDVGDTVNIGDFKGVVYLSQEQYDTLIKNGGVVVDGYPVVYDENKLYVTPDTSSSDVVDELFLKKTGGTITGPLTLSNNKTTSAVETLILKNEAVDLFENGDTQIAHTIAIKDRDNRNIGEILTGITYDGASFINIIARGKEYDIDMPYTSMVYINSNEGITIGGDLTVSGNLKHKGDPLVEHAQHIYSKDDYIILRDGSNIALGNGEYSGFEFVKYDGVNNGRLVVDNQGIARVGDVGDEQPLATREETPIDGGFAKWDASTNKFITSSESYLPLTAGSDKKLTGDLYIRDGTTTKNLYLGSSSRLRDNGSGAFVLSTSGTMYFRPSGDGNATNGLELTSLTFKPQNNEGNNLGTSTSRWKEIHGTTIYQNGNKVADELKLRTYQSLIPAGSSIPANADLNTPTYLTVGNHYCQYSSDAKTLVNCPTQSAFLMTVYSPLSTALDTETTSAWIYRVRKILTFQGDEYIQYAYTSGTANVYTYEPWKKIINSAGGNITGVLDFDGNVNFIDLGTTSYMRGRTSSGTKFDLLGLINSTRFQVGGSYPSLELRGKDSRPKYFTGGGSTAEYVAFTSDVDNIGTMELLASLKMNNGTQIAWDDYDRWTKYRGVYFMAKHTDHYLEKYIPTYILQNMHMSASDAFVLSTDSSYMTLYADSVNSFKCLHHNLTDGTLYVYGVR